MGSFVGQWEAVLLAPRITLLVGSAAMNIEPIIWGLVGGTGVLALCGILTKLEHGDRILTRLVTIRLCSGARGDKAERIIALEHNPF